MQNPISIRKTLYIRPLIIRFSNFFWIMIEKKYFKESRKFTSGKVLIKMQTIFIIPAI